MKIMRLKIFPLYLVLPFLVVLTACEDVIHLDLKNAEPRMVIDASLNATKGECTVQVTKSLDFYQTDSFQRIERAKVELISGTGGATVLTEITPGVYFAGNIKVAADEGLKLIVEISTDEKYEASARVPVAVSLDSVKIVRGFGDPRPTSPPIYLVNPVWNDPAGIANYYRFKVTKNGRLRNGSFSITNDEPFDGTRVDMPLYRYDFSIGDTVQLEFQSIDSVSYSYYNQINDMARPSFVSATPYNPVGNFDKSALGYFGVYWSDIRDMMVVKVR
jgi:hypothetical protein